MDSRQSELCHIRPRLEEGSPQNLTPLFTPFLACNRYSRNRCRKVKKFTSPLEPAMNKFFDPQQIVINLSERFLLFQLKRRTRGTQRLPGSDARTLVARQFRPAPPWAGLQQQLPGLSRGLRWELSFEELQQTVRGRSAKTYPASSTPPPQLSGLDFSGQLQGVQTLCSLDLQLLL